MYVMAKKLHVGYGHMLEKEEELESRGLGMCRYNECKTYFHIAVF